MDEQRHRNSESPINSDSLLGGFPDAKILLKGYNRTAKIHARSYELSEAYYRNMYKYFTYPLVVLTAVSSVLAGLNINQYALMSLSLLTLILVGFNAAINPKDKESKANQIKTEMAEISGSIRHFIMSNKRTDNELKEYSSVVHEQVNIWSSLSPAIQSKFVEQAKRELAPRSRRHALHDSEVQKK